MAEQLNQLRAKIDAIDNELLELINARAKLAQEVGHQKGNAVTYRPEREAQVLSRLQQLNTGPLSNERIAALFIEIISACRAMEAPLTIAYLGPPGTFSEEAVSKRFGHAVITTACHSIDDVFRQVESGAVHYGVVPVENSTEGAVGRTMDLLVQTPLTVCGEIELPVHHCLMAKHSDLTKIKKSIHILSPLGNVLDGLIINLLSLNQLHKLMLLVMQMQPDLLRKTLMRQQLRAVKLQRFLDWRSARAILKMILITLHDF